MLQLNEADKLLMIPGPTPVQREILSAISEPTISHTSDAMAEIVRRCLSGLLDIVGDKTARAFVFGGAGTLAQETAVINLVAPGERLLVASNGFFGDRFVPLAEAHGIDVQRVAADWGTSITPAQLDRSLTASSARAVTITQVETSTGVLAPVRELAAVARRHGAYVIVDAVCGLGGVPLSMMDDGADIVLSGAQKALGVPPGLTILIVSERGMDRRRAMGRVNGYYTDLLNWEPSMVDPQVYFSTHAVNMFYALHASLEIVAREGLPERFARHEVLARAFRAAMDALDFPSLTEERYMAPTMSVRAYPGGISDEAFRGVLSQNGVVAAGCLGAFKGRGARFGHMGNITAVEILRAVGAIEQTVTELTGRSTHGAGVGAAQAALLEPGSVPVGD